MTFEDCSVLPEGRVEIEAMRLVWGVVRERYGIELPVVSKRKSIVPGGMMLVGLCLV